MAWIRACGSSRQKFKFDLILNGITQVSMNSSIKRSSSFSKSTVPWEFSSTYNGYSHGEVANQYSIGFRTSDLIDFTPYTKAEVTYKNTKDNIERTMELNLEGVNRSGYFVCDLYNENNVVKFMCGITTVTGDYQSGLINSEVQTQNHSYSTSNIVVMNNITLS